MMREVALEFDRVGWRTTVQDLGRSGTERSGVPRGGAADQTAARIANILVGNIDSAPLIESLGGSIGLRASDDVLVAVTGSVAGVAMDGLAIDHRQPFLLPRGSRLLVEGSDHAARTYLAVSGALRVPRFLGSAAPDARMGFAQAVGVGTQLIVDTAVRAFVQPEFGRALFRFDAPSVRVAPGERHVDIVDCAETDSVPGIREVLARGEYVVNMKSDHVGVRLDGPVSHPEPGDEIVSHGVPIGAVEIPHSDELIVLGRYRTLTAGYPIVAFVTTAGQDAMGQARPGQRVRFRWVERQEARREAAAREARVESLRRAVRLAHEALGIPTAAAHPLQRTSAGTD